MSALDYMEGVSFQKSTMLDKVTNAKTEVIIFIPTFYSESWNKNNYGNGYTGCP